MYIAALNENYSINALKAQIPHIELHKKHTNTTMNTLKTLTATPIKKTVAKE